MLTQGDFYYRQQTAHGITGITKIYCITLYINTCKAVDVAVDQNEVHNEMIIFNEV